MVWVGLGFGLVLAKVWVGLGFSLVLANGVGWFGFLLGSRKWCGLVWVLA